MHVTPNLNFDGLWTQREQKTIHQSRLRLIVKGIVKGVTGRAWSEKRSMYIWQGFSVLFFSSIISSTWHILAVNVGVQICLSNHLSVLYLLNVRTRFWRPVTS